MNALDKVKYNDLTPDQKELADLVGLDIFKSIVKTFGGSNLYIPKIESVSRAARDDMIRQEFNGHNYKDLANRYSLTDVRIRSMIKKGE